MSTRDHFRAFARRPVHLAANVALVNGSWRDSARVRDLGLGGACLELVEPLSPGTPVKLQLSAPHLWDSLELSGHIAWAREAQDGAAARVGLSFDHGSGKTLRWLIELLALENYA